MSRSVLVGPQCNEREFLGVSEREFLGVSERELRVSRSVGLWVSRSVNFWVSWTGLSVTNVSLWVSRAVCPRCYEREFLDVCWASVQRA